PRRGGHQGTNRPRPPCTDVPRREPVPAHRVVASRGVVLADRISVLARRLGRCRRPVPRRTRRLPRPKSARRQPRAAAGLPRVSGAHRSAPATRVAHGENHGTRGSRPRPVPETRWQSEPGGRPPSRRRNRSGLGRRPRYASRPSLWWTTKRAVLPAADPWNAVSHSLFFLAALRPPLEPDDDEGHEGDEAHVLQFRDGNDGRGPAPRQGVPSRR